MSDWGVPWPQGGPLVLLVDDVEDNREIYEQFLLYSGYRVQTAIDGYEALEMAVRVQPDVIVMDLGLPGMDGWEVTRRLKADRRSRSIPVVALSAHAHQTARTDAMGAGCQTFLAKPCLPEDLAKELSKLLADNGGRGLEAQARS